MLIAGPSGSGKTQTALTVLRRARAAKLPSFFVADDQVLLSRVSGKDELEAACPPPIRNAVEVFGVGILKMDGAFTETAPVHLYADLVAAEHVSRMAPEQPRQILGVSIRELKVPQGHPSLCATAILSALGVPVWI